MLNGKEGRLLRRNNDKDTRMKINTLLCDDDKDFLQRISDAVAGQPVPPGASICITKSSNPAEITAGNYHSITSCSWTSTWMNAAAWTCTPCAGITSGYGNYFCDKLPGIFDGRV